MGERRVENRFRLGPNTFKRQRETSYKKLASEKRNKPIKSLGLGFLTFRPRTQKLLVLTRSRSSSQLNTNPSNPSSNHKCTKATFQPCLSNSSFSQSFPFSKTVGNTDVGNGLVAGETFTASFRAVENPFRGHRITLAGFQWRMLWR